MVINLLSLSIVFAQPQGAQVEKGTATFTSPDTSTLNITASNNSIINFRSFDITKNETVNIILPSNAANLLIRDTSNTESHILGSLFSNGDVILTNPNGINFGPSAKGKVYNLIASSLEISSNEFISENYVFEHRKNAPYGQVSNEGTITTKNLVLQGSSVNNSGDIKNSLEAINKKTTSRIKDVGQEL
jgi:filamentous hemagglutinin family protein